jgi:hypothetical protein
MFGKNFRKAKPGTRPSASLFNRPATATEGLSRLRTGGGLGQALGPGGIPLVKLLAGLFGLKFVQLPAGGIAERSGVTVSSGTCTELDFDGVNKLTVGTVTGKYFNPWNTAAPAGKYALAGHLLSADWVLIWDCA